MADPEELAAVINAPLTDLTTTRSAAFILGLERCTRNIAPVTAASLRAIQSINELQQMRAQPILVMKIVRRIPDNNEDEAARNEEVGSFLVDGEKRLVLLVACHGAVQGRISGSLGPTTSTLMLSVILREYLQAAGQTIDDVKRQLLSLALGENCIPRAFASLVFLQHKLQRLSSFVHPTNGDMPITTLKALNFYYDLMCPSGTEHDMASKSDPKGYRTKVTNAALHMSADCVNYICEYYSTRGCMVTTVLRLANWPILKDTARQLRVVKQTVKQGLKQVPAQRLLDDEILAATQETKIRASQIAAAQALQEAQRVVQDGVARRVEGSNGAISDGGLQYLSVMGAVENYRCAPETGPLLIGNVHRACQEPPKLEDVGGSVHDCSAGVIVATRAATSLGLKLEDGVLKAAASIRKGALVIPEVYARPVSGVVTTKPIQGFVRIFTTDLRIAAVAASNGKGRKIPGRKADRLCLAVGPASPLYYSVPPGRGESENAALTCTVGGCASVSSTCAIPAGTSLVIASANQVSLPASSEQRGSGIGVQFLSLDKASSFDRPGSVLSVSADCGVRHRTSVLACLTNEAIARDLKAPVSVTHADAVQTLLSAKNELLLCNETGFPDDDEDLHDARVLVCKSTIAAAELCLQAEEVKEEELHQHLLSNVGGRGFDNDDLIESMAAAIESAAAIMNGSATALMPSGCVMFPLSAEPSEDFNEKPIVFRASVPIMAQDALELAAEYNLGNGEKKSRYHTAEISPTRGLEGSARELAQLRDDLMGYMNINGLDLNGSGTSLSGEVIHNFGEYLLNLVGKSSSVLAGELIRATHPITGTHVVQNKEVEGRTDFHGPAIFVSLDGTWMHIDVATGSRDKYGGLLSASNFRQLQSDLYTLDAVVFITGPPRSYGKHVKDVLIVERASYEKVVALYEGYFVPDACPGNQDSSKHIDWLLPSSMLLLEHHDVNFEVFKLYVGDSYILPAGCLHYFKNVLDVPIHSCLGYNVRLKRPQDITATRY